MMKDHSILDPEVLFREYEPLRKAVSKKFSSMMHNYADKEDLFSTINIIFMQLVMEYNPRRGVDFPYYIKKMLELRTHHYITKYLKTINKEICEEDFSVYEDSYEEKDLDRIIEIMSLDPNMVLGEKHRRLMEGLMLEKKTLKEMAIEEGVPVDRLHARLYFLIRKSLKEYNKLVDRYGGEIY